MGKGKNVEKDKKNTKREPITEQQLLQIQKLAKNLRFGSITLVFQDNVLVQIERNEKIRVSGQTFGTCGDEPPGDP